MEGDRVRLSRELERDLLKADVIRPFARTYARRLPRAPAVLEEIATLEAKHRESLFDGLTLPLMAAPARPKAPPRKRERIPPPALLLEYPPSIADILPSLGATHEEIAALMGLSRPQVSNIIVGRFGMSHRYVLRVLELARAA